jgi:hypothetical protein
VLYSRPSIFELATLPPAPGRRQAGGRELLSQFFSYQLWIVLLRNAMSSTTMENIEGISSEIWKELEEASKVEPALDLHYHYPQLVQVHQLLHHGLV